MSEKLQKVLARAGLGSRREIETWIEEGRLVVNGYPALLGTRVEPKDEVKLDGRRLKLIPESLVNRKILMYHKPEGEVTTRKDPEGRPTVFDRLPPMRGSRWVAIGRLDLNTSGLLLFTNDGEVANRLMHPSHEVEREYAVRILGELKPSQRKKLLEGVVLEDGLAKFNSIESRGGGGSNRWYHVTLSEGRTREVRRMFESMDLVVSRLIRVRYGPVALDPLLKQGMNRELNLEETNRLCEAVGIEPQAPRAERRREYQQTRRSESVGGSGDFEGDSFGGERAATSARKPKVIGNKDDDLPLDRVERAAELLRRRRAAESAGVDFSGRNRRLSGKRTLRESELRRLAEEKAAAKKLEGAASSTGLKRSAVAGKTRSTAASFTEDEAPRRTRSAVGSRSSSADKPASRSRAGVGASSRDDSRGSVRAAPARARTRVGRDEDEVAPRRSARPAARPTRASEEEAPRRRSSSKPAGASSERPARSRSSASGGERSSSARTADSRTSDSRKPAARSSAAPRASASRGAAKPAGRSAAAKPAGRSSAAKPASRSSAAKPAGRSEAAKPARNGSRPAAPSRAGGGSKPAGTSRGGAGRSGASRNGPSAGKGKRTR